MTEILDILKYLLPSLVVLATTLYLAGKYFAGEEKKRRHQLALNNQNMITPLRLQAYERMVLFLERISPESLVVRLNRPGMTCLQLQNELLNAIRQEYEHNLAQQIYVSPDAWDMLRVARARTIQLINVSAEKVSKDSPSMDLSRAILESVVDQERTPASEAMAFIKKEIRELF